MSHRDNLQLKKKLILIVSLILICGCSATRQIAPTAFPHVGPEHEMADFWVDRLAHPQAVIMSPDQIIKMNHLALSGDANLTDIFAIRVVERSVIANLYSKLRKQFQTAVYYDHTNYPVRPSFLSAIFSSMSEETLPEKMMPSFALVTRSTELRELPTEEILMGKPDDAAFDLLQYARLACGTPVAVLHYSGDRQWCLVQTSFAMGWVRTLDVAVGPKEEIMRFSAMEPLIVTGEHEDVYFDASFKLFAAAIPMGSGLPCLDQTSEFRRILIPWRNSEGEVKIVKGYVRASADVHRGFLPYTAEQVLRQAFKLYGQPYGWGGHSEGETAHASSGIFSGVSVSKCPKTVSGKPISTRKGSKTCRV